MKKKEIEKLQEKEKALYATFQTSLGENNKFADYLTKVFKKRIKRSKKKTTEGDGKGYQNKLGVLKAVLELISHLGRHTHQ